jgi:alpha-glucosidase (family GH31 glycosyl hydrolase)
MQSEMNAWPKHFELAVEPAAQPEAVLRGPNVRFTVLTSRLLRLEYSPSGDFEDRASQAFWFGRQPVPDFEVVQSPTRMEIITEHLHLCYAVGQRGFKRGTLSIKLRETGTVWHFGDRNPDNLLGTARTLDGANGRVRMEPGLMSRAGWAVVDDSAGLVFDDEGWLTPRTSPKNVDLYFWGYGHDYLACLRDFYKVAGPAPLIPRWALGNWWSRYWAYSQSELIQLMKDFKSHGVPLSVCTVDMDWHLTQTGNASSGWTGYTWNPEFFPDPEAFLHRIHELGLKAALNLHPAAGVYPHEAQFAAMAERLGIDPASAESVPFDIADREFAVAYLDILHHPMEAQGVDFWWIDWQQGGTTALVGLDPLWWLNHVHFYDLGRDGQKRPLILSRWGGLGNHRYPIGFSGDTVVSWKSLAFQPYFTATAANVGYGWWSHDIGGHMGGIEDPELYARWVQFGVFSPILRTHCTKNAYHERRPWAYDAETFRITQSAMQLRHALVPYLYSAAWRAVAEGRTLILPMYFLHADEEAAYRCPNQYYFGSELIVAPYVTQLDPETRLSRQVVWLPQGDWFDFFTGERYVGGRWHVLYGKLEDIPVLARAGGIVPMGPQAEWGGIANPEELTVHVFAGGDNAFELYEDDGESQAHLQGRHCVTRLRLAWYGDRLEFSIAPAEGDRSLVPAQRTVHLVFHGIRSPEEMRLALNGVDASPNLVYDDNVIYDDADEALTVRGIVLKPSDEVRLSLVVRSGTLLSGRDRRKETCRKLLRSFRLDTGVKHRLDRHLDQILEGRASLMAYGTDLADAHLSALLHTVQG